MSKIEHVVSTHSRGYDLTPLDAVASAKLYSSLQQAVPSSAFYLGVAESCAMRLADQVAEFIQKADATISDFPFFVVLSEDTVNYENAMLIKQNKSAVVTGWRQLAAVITKRDDCFYKVAVADKDYIYDFFGDDATETEELTDMVSWFVITKQSC